MEDNTPKQRIHQLSLKLGISVREIAEKAEMSQATLYHITDESRTITPRTAAKICYNLERKMGVVVNREWLLTGKGEMLDERLSAALPLASEDAAEFGPTGWKAKYYALLEQYTELQQRYIELVER